MFFVDVRVGVEKHIRSLRVMQIWYRSIVTGKVTFLGFRFFARTLQCVLSYRVSQ
ncbi:hypothetical protein KOR42_55620 [Thalassoglobus neptunius]|uniref:Uncharacterized protein n=1 Tax=Thalassoglobus neptunius TaxID=1938619 RepID=A0A5C5UTG9_9PLAN|nr:hypothetical protein KOR42_55620 [Thalassoglobus neptunius]